MCLPQAKGSVVISNTTSWQLISNHIQYTIQLLWLILACSVIAESNKINVSNNIFDRKQVITKRLTTHFWLFVCAVKAIILRVTHRGECYTQTIITFELPWRAGHIGGCRRNQFEFNSGGIRLSHDIMHHLTVGHCT